MQNKTKKHSNNCNYRSYYLFIKQKNSTIISSFYRETESHFSIYYSAGCDSSQKKIL